MNYFTIIKSLLILSLLLSSSTYSEELISNEKSEVISEQKPQINQKTKSEIKAIIDLIETKSNKARVGTIKIDNDFKELFVADLLEDSQRWQECWSYYQDFTNEITYENFKSWSSCVTHIVSPKFLSHEKKKYLNTFNILLKIEEIK